MPGLSKVAPGDARHFNICSNAFTSEHHVKKLEPTSSKQSKVRSEVRQRGLLDGLVGRRIERTDADVIAGALEYGRSGVSSDALFGQEADGRGNGLWRMCELAETFDYADVRFTSLKGDVVYAKGGALEQTTLTSRFCGTMIRWRATISARELEV